MTTISNPPKTLLEAGRAARDAGVISDKEYATLTDGHVSTRNLQTARQANIEHVGRDAVERVGRDGRLSPDPRRDIAKEYLDAVQRSYDGQTRRRIVWETAKDTIGRLF